MNQIFGYQILPDGISSNDIVFEGTQHVLPSTDFDAEPAQVKIFGEPQTHLQYCFSQKYKAYSYVWGIPVHPEITTKDIPEWCASVVAAKRYDRFKELVGTFIVIIDEPGQRGITFVTDILGIRPLFLGKHNGRIIFGSNVWSIHRAGVIRDNIDYDAVSAWINYGINYTDGSLFSDLRRLPPGSAVILKNNQYTEISYVEFESKSEETDIETVSEEIHHIVSSTVKTMVANHHRIFVPLSGGYDSRYLLALSLSHGVTSVECATVSSSEEEDKVAHQVAEILGVPLETYNIIGSIWNLYDEPYHLMADGFPISKFVPYRIAQDYPGIHMVNGFMGDALIRGDSDMYMGKYETEWEENLIDVLQRKHSKLIPWLLRKEIVERIKTRSRPPMERAVREGSKISKVFGWQDFYYTHRFCISNNFLQHIDLAEALIPFYNWSLLSYKMAHDYRVFNMDTYRGIYQKYFPELTKILHSSDLPRKKPKRVRVAKCTKIWARELFPKILDPECLSLLEKKLCIPVDIAGIAGIRKTESLIFFLRRLYLLEKRLKDAGLDFDWECI
ncbi:MAG: hypothetical protein GY941_11280 [Planctomycetes bacterium]|nr:hypothetical protein [Planctomycetota bacterium]